MNERLTAEKLVGRISARPFYLRNSISLQQWDGDIANVWWRCNGKKTWIMYFIYIQYSYSYITNRPRDCYLHIFLRYKPVYFHITMNTKYILDICLFVGIKLNIYLAVKNKLHIFNAVYTIVTDIANLSWQHLLFII